MMEKPHLLMDLPTEGPGNEHDISKDPNQLHRAVSGNDSTWSRCPSSCKTHFSKLLSSMWGLSLKTKSWLKRVDFRGSRKSYKISLSLLSVSIILSPEVRTTVHWIH